MRQHKLNVKDIRLRLRQLREDRKLSMRELAAKADLSVSLISKVEAGKVSPTVMTLQKILDGMDVDLYEFLLNKSDIDPADQIIFKKADMAVSEDEEHTWYYAFPKHPNIKVELTYEEYQPHTSVIERESHKGDICGFVVSGELALDVIDRGTFTAKKGDAFYVKAGQLHVARNEGDKVLKVVAAQLR
ncbi:MAG: cupin domain-containing protein [Armatimonadota bacterium]